MTDDALVDRLDRVVDLVLRRGDATAALQDPELAPLVRIAADLRHYPSPAFKQRVRAQLERRTVMSATLAPPNIREGFTTITPYLTVKPGIVDFLSRVFDARETFSSLGTAGEMHREVVIGNSMIMIGEVGTQQIEIRPGALHAYVENADASYERALSAGATSLGAPADRPYGERSGFVKDPFGNHWYIATALRGPHVPEGLRTVTPFVHASGAASYIEFLKRGLGAVEEGRHAADGVVRYARLRIGDAAVELGEAEGAAEKLSSSFYLYVADADALYERAMAAGAKSLWAPSAQPYGDRMGGVEDPIGNQWYIATPLAR